MKQGTIEKSAQLSTAKVVLGHDAMPLDVSLEPFYEQKSSETAAHVAQPMLSPRERIAELDAQLAASTRQVVELEQQLNDLRDSDAINQAALTELQKSLAAAQRAAEQSGYADGSAAAQQAVHNQWQQTAELWAQGVAELAEQCGEYRKQLQASVADIAMAAIAKIIGEQSTDAQQIGKAIEYLIHESGLAGAMKVFLAPTHYEELLRAGGTTLQRLVSRQVELQPDPRVGYGGCLLETSGAMVDGRYEVQLKKLQTIVSEFHPVSDTDDAA